MLPSNSEASPEVGGFMRLGGSGGATVDRVHAKGVVLLRKGVFLPSKHLLSAFYNTPPSKNPSENPCPY